MAAFTPEIIFPGIHPKMVLMKPSVDKHFRMCGNRFLFIYQAKISEEIVVALFSEIFSNFFPRFHVKHIPHEGNILTYVLVNLLSTKRYDGMKYDRYMIETIQPTIYKMDKRSKKIWDQIYGFMEHMNHSLYGSDDPSQILKFAPLYDGALVEFTSSCAPIQFTQKWQDTTLGWLDNCSLVTQSLTPILNIYCEPTHPSKVDFVIWMRQNRAIDSLIFPNGVPTEKRIKKAMDEAIRRRWSRRFIIFMLSHDDEKPSRWLEKSAIIESLRYDKITQGNVRAILILSNPVITITEGVMNPENVVSVDIRNEPDALTPEVPFNSAMMEEINGAFETVSTPPLLRAKISSLHEKLMFLQVDKR